MTSTHPVQATGLSQSAKVLARLREAVGGPNGGRVPMPELVRVSGSYNVHSRISDLREQGHSIFNATKRQGGVSVSEYWIVEKQEASV